MVTGWAVLASVQPTTCPDPPGRNRGDASIRGVGTSRGFFASLVRGVSPVQVSHEILSMVDDLGAEPLRLPEDMGSDLARHLEPDRHSHQ